MSAFFIFTKFSKKSSTGKNLLCHFLAIELAIASSTGGQNSPFLIHLSVTANTMLYYRAACDDRRLAQYARLYSTESSYIVKLTVSCKRSLLCVFIALLVYIGPAG